MLTARLQNNNRSRQNIVFFLSDTKSWFGQECWLDYGFISPGSFAQVESGSLAVETVEKPPQCVGEEGGGGAPGKDSWKEDVFGEGGGTQKQK